VGWLDYLKSHTVKDLVSLGVHSNEFKIRFVDGKSDGILARTLYDVLLARAGDPGGLDHWEEYIRLHGWESAVDSILASTEYNNGFGDDAVPGGGRAGCGPLVVEQFYCRVLQRPPESDQAIAGWLNYLKSHTVKDLVSLGVHSNEFKIRFIDGKSDETLARILYDVLLARAGDPGGLVTWEAQISMHGWDSVVNSILASGEYNNNFGDDAVPGGGRAGCGSQEDPSKMTSLGVAPATGGQTTNMRSQGGISTHPENVVCGAVQAVLAHPENADVCFAGATNGGVWRTTSCTAALPNWEPLTDDQESLSVGDMVYDKDDVSYATILVGIGARSSFYRTGGPKIGLLYTQNALAANPDWQILDNGTGDVKFRENQVQFVSVFARGDLMMAAAYLANPFSCPYVGVFRSTDRGATWMTVLPGVARAIASDPNDPNRFYATVDYAEYCRAESVEPNGVFTSSDAGETWAATTGQQVAAGTISLGELNNAKLSVSADGSRVWSALLKNGVANDISYSDDQGATWNHVDTVQTEETDGDIEGLNPREKPGSQGSIHFALLASPTNRDEIYVGGDRQDAPFPNFIGAVNYSGRLFRGNAAVPSGGGSTSPFVPSPQWEHMTDTQNLGFPGGGTASSSGPHADCRDMEIRADGSLLEGDDGGIAVRTSPQDNTGDWFGVCGNMQVFETHSVAYEPVLGTVLFGNQDTGTIAGVLGVANSFETVAKADGNDCMIDYKSDGAQIYLYYGYQNYGAFFRARVSTTTGNTLGVTDIAANLPNSPSFLSVTAMNPFDQKILAVAASVDVVMLSLDRGSTTFINYGVFTGDTQITAMAWSANGEILYVAGGVTGKISSCALSNTGILNCSVKVPVGSFTRHLAVNPTNSAELFAATVGSDHSSPAVFKSTIGGANWIDIDTAASPLDTAAMGGSVVYISNSAGPVNTVAVGTSNGVLVPDGTNSWRVLAAGLPTVAVLDMVYDETDDLLVVATLGRGVWFMEGASEVAVAVGRTRGLGEWKSARTGGLKNRKLGGISLDFSSLLDKQAEANVAMMPPEPNPGYD
jgi:hypothetical protein